MSRVCIIGNSHLGAFRMALDGGPIAGVSDRYEFDTFGSIRASILQTRISEGRLIPTRKDVTENFERTSGGQSEIDLTRYSSFVIAIRNNPFWIKPYLFDSDFGPVTRAMVQAIHEDFLADWSLDLTARIAETVPQAQVYFVGRPLNSDRDFLARKLRRQLEGEEAAAITAAKDQLLRQINATVADTPVAANVTLVRPPDHMLDPHRLFTQSRYSRGADQAQTGLKHVYKDDDTQHMNGDYGRDMLIHMLAAA